jgi:hypothetical protein
MQKIFLFSTITILFPIMMLAQIIPNGDFENWTNGTPNYWTVSNVPKLYKTIINSNKAHSGKRSLKGIVVNYYNTLIPPVIQTSSRDGFPVSKRYASITGFYQFKSKGGDAISINGSLTKNKNIIGLIANTLEVSSSWKRFNFDYTYFTNDIPEKASILIQIINQNGSVHKGSFFLMDNLNLAGLSNPLIEEKKVIPSKLSLEQNYPDPFNPSTKIKFCLPEKLFVNLKVYNSIGSEIASLVKGVTPAGIHEVSFNASNYTSGVFFYTLITGNNFVQTRKMILMK